MALIACPECTTEVSSTALNCVKCGVQLRKPTRTVVGKIIKWLFILFNLLMVWSMFSGVGAAGEVMNTSADEYEQAGAAIGTGIGVMMLLMLWAFGDIVLGLLVLLTRPK